MHKLVFAHTCRNHNLIIKRPLPPYFFSIQCAVILLFVFSPWIPQCILKLFKSLFIKMSTLKCHFLKSRVHVYLINVILFLICLSILCPTRGSRKRHTVTSVCFSTENFESKDFEFYLNTLETIFLLCIF